MKVTDEDKQAIKKILNVEKESQIICVPITENTTRGVTQYKVVIPKKLAVLVGLSKAKHQIQFQITPNRELIAKVIPL